MVTTAHDTRNTLEVNAVHGPDHPSRVPVEHRWLGLDRRSVGYGVVAFGVVALWAWVMPWVNAQVAWDDTTRSTEAFRVSEQVTMSVPPGWGVLQGLRTTDEPRQGAQAAEEQQTVLTKNGVVFSVQQAPVDVSPARLLDQAERITGAQVDGYRVSGQIRTVSTATGLRGVTQSFSTANSAGAVTAFVIDGVGFEIQVAGPEAQATAMSSETDAMIDSLAQDGGAR